MIIIVPVDVNLKREAEARNMVHPTIVRRINALSLWLLCQPVMRHLRLVHTRETAEFAGLLKERINRFDDPPGIELKQDDRLGAAQYEWTPISNLSHTYGQVAGTVLFLVPIEIWVWTLRSFGWAEELPTIEPEVLFGQLATIDPETSSQCVLDYRPCLFGSDAKQLLPAPALPEEDPQEEPPSQEDPPAHEA